MTAATDLGNIDWLPDGSGWLSKNARSDRSELIYATKDGRSRVLWTFDRTFVYAAIPSRDGKHLAIQTVSDTANVWLLTGL